MPFDHLTRYIDSLSEMGIPGCKLIVWQDHKCIYRHMHGEGLPGQPIRGDELYWLYSATKVFTMTAAMQLIEQDRMHLADPVGDYLPAYRHLTVNDNGTIRPARTVMTLENLMSMQGGMDYEIDRPEVRACIEQNQGQATTRQIVDVLAQKPLLFDPGTRFRYSLCHDVMAAVIETVSGMTLSEYMQRNIFEPLGIQDFTFHPTPSQRERIAACYRWDDENRSIPMDNQANAFSPSPAYESGGAGLLGNADGYILLADALANGGVGWNGNAILSPESIDEMRTRRLYGIAQTDFETTCPQSGYSYALGVRTLADPESSLSPMGEFGWDGAAGAWMMADPKNHLAAFYVQHVHSCDRAFREFHPGIRDRIYQGLRA